ncbi:HK97 family phage prohead protease [Streptomyces cavernicola]|uniref:HK97 family phage prohead protease n=1 Tax=Streptomyces cavernicola TaxID=3043613 RepID=A0ABT6SHJ9_9ACTN|nr:HK97 family phage prohead protease [Streptomyces sp. B-S-A6]MDI3407673.1 HK97 family phage prohead protease [Streptomyces sp. B-S-A6]
MPTAPTSRAPAPRKGICRAIFAVTGVVDEVADLIVPGAFAHTLATRPVKTVWHHEWKEPIGVVLEIAEWQPGDPKFADIPNWPTEAGALVATIQFNLRTSKGRDVYEQVRQWHTHGEAQFSIGYRVPPSGATRSDGVRVIHKLDLYEVSPVLHGAHPMTRSLEVKADPGSTELEHKATADTTLGKNELGIRANVEAKNARAAVLEAKAAAGPDKNHGDAEHLRHWYKRGEGATQIAWGTAGDFDRCVAIAGRHMGSDNAKGYCNLRHRDATGIYPATQAAESKSAHAAVLEAKSRIIPGATVSPIQPLPASYEEIRDRVAAAVRHLLATEEGTWTCVEATYPDRVIVSVHQDGAGAVNYAVPYDGTGPEITLGTPLPVELTTVVIPDQGPAREADPSEAADNRVVRPTMRALTDATTRIQAAGGAEQLEPVRATVGELLAALSAKGLDIGDDDAEEPPAPPSPMAGNGAIDLWDDDPYDEPHDSRAPETPDTDEGEDERDGEDTVLLDPAEVKAQLAAIQG